MNLASTLNTDNLPPDPQDVRDDLPPFIDAADMLANPESEPPVLIDGLLHQGSKFVIGGCSKSFKTWCLTDMAISIALGIPWWGVETVVGKVLYLNFEIQPCFFTKRIAAICRAKKCTIDRTHLVVLNMRGYAAGFDLLLPNIAERITGQKYSLVIVDPIYKGLGSLNENDAGDMAKLLNEVELLAVKTGAAAAFGAHFSKGNQSGKEAIDRISGSGVFARDPDTILTMTRHEEENAFTIDATLRNFAPMDPFCVRWQYPLMVRDDELDPSKLKQVIGRKATYTVEQITALLKADGMTTTEWKTCCEEEKGVSKSTFHRLVTEAQEKGLISKIGEKWKLVPKVPEVPE